MFWIEASAVPPLRAAAANGGWTIVDVNTVDVLRTLGGFARLPQLDAERMAEAARLAPGSPLPLPQHNPETSP